MWAHSGIPIGSIDDPSGGALALIRHGPLHHGLYPSRPLSVVTSIRHDLSPSYPLSVMTSLRHTLYPSWPGVSRPPTLGRWAASEIVQPPVRGWPGHARP